MSSLAVILLATIIVAVIAGAIYQRLGSLRDARELPPPGRLIAAGGRRLHLYCLGDDVGESDGRRDTDGRVSVIFESGLAASSLNWRIVQEQVAQFARVCAYDRAGYGWSARARGSRSARVSAADLDRLLQSANVPPPYILVSHSFGTYIALEFAAAHAEEMAGLVLVDPITPDEWREPDAAQRRLLIGGRLFSLIGAALASVGIVRFLLRGTRERGSGSSLSTSVLRSFGREADAVVRRVVGEVTKMPRELWPAVQAHWSRPAAFLTMAQHFRALQQSAIDVQATLSSSPSFSPPGGAPTCPLRDVPIIVISAANMPEHRVKEQRLLADLSRCGSHVHATSGGHWVHLDEPSLVVDAICSLARHAVQIDRHRTR